MGLTVTFVSGPRCTGKSALIRGMIDRLWKKEPHYIRLVCAGSGKLPPNRSRKPIPPCGVATARWLEYDAEHVFEVLPEGLTAIHQHDRNGSVVIEADADPILRHAYPYDHQVFVMAMPTAVSGVFTDPSRAAEEFYRALDDTMAFATAAFGLSSERAQDEVEPSEERPPLSDTTIGRIIDSPGGEELAARVLLRESYRGLVESDVIVVNPAVGESGPEGADCLQRIEQVLRRISRKPERDGVLFLCDPRESNTKAHRKLDKALRRMFERNS